MSSATLIEKGRKSKPMLLFLNVFSYIAAIALLGACSGDDPPVPAYQPTTSQAETLRLIDQRIAQEATRLASEQGDIDGTLRDDLLSFITQYYHQCAGRVGSPVTANQTLNGGPIIAPGGASSFNPGSSVCMDYLTYHLYQHGRTLLPLFQNLNPAEQGALIARGATWFQGLANNGGPIGSLAAAHNPFTTTTIAIATAPNTTGTNTSSTTPPAGSRFPAPAINLGNNIASTSFATPWIVNGLPTNGGPSLSVRGFQGRSPATSQVVDLSAE